MNGHTGRWARGAATPPLLLPCSWPPFLPGAIVVFPGLGRSAPHGEGTPPLREEDAEGVHKEAASAAAAAAAAATQLLSAAAAGGGAGRGHLHRWHRAGNAVAAAAPNAVDAPDAAGVISPQQAAQPEALGPGGTEKVCGWVSMGAIHLHKVANGGGGRGGGGFL